MAAAGAALLFGGDRLALTRPRPNSLRFAHTFTTESERAILDAAVAEFEQAHPGLRIEQLISNSETYNTVGWRLQFQRRLRSEIGVLVEEVEELSFARQKVHASLAFCYRSVVAIIAFVPGRARGRCCKLGVPQSDDQGRRNPRGRRAVFLILSSRVWSPR